MIPSYLYDLVNKSTLKTKKKFNYKVNQSSDTINPPSYKTNQPNEKKATNILPIFSISSIYSLTTNIDLSPAATRKIDYSSLSLAPIY